MVLIRFCLAFALFFSSVSLVFSSTFHEELNQISFELSKDVKSAKAQRKLLHLSNQYDLDSSDHLKIIALMDLIEFNHQAEKRISAYRNRVRDLKYSLNNQGVTADLIEKYLQKTTNQTLKLISTKPPIDSKIIQSESFYENLLSKLKNQKSFLQREMDLAMKEYDVLFDFDQDALLQASIQLEKDKTENVVVEKIKVEPILLRQEDLSNTPEAVEKYKLKLAELDQKYQDLSREARRKDERIQTLKLEVMDLTLEIARKDAQLKVKYQPQKSATDEEYEDLQARFDLTSKIIEEKDRQIVALEKETEHLRQKENQLLSEYSKVVDLKDQQIEEFNGVVHIYASMLQDITSTLEKRNQDLELMMEKTLSVQSVLEEKDLALRKSSEDLDILKFLVDEMKGQAFVMQQYPRQTAEMIPDFEHELLSLEVRLSNVSDYLFRQFDETYLLQQRIKEEERIHANNKMLQSMSF